VAKDQVKDVPAYFAQRILDKLHLKGSARFRSVEPIPSKHTFLRKDEDALCDQVLGRACFADLGLSANQEYRRLFKEAACSRRLIVHIQRDNSAMALAMLTADIEAVQLLIDEASLGSTPDAARVPKLEELLVGMRKLASSALSCDVPASFEAREDGPRQRLALCRLGALTLSEEEQTHLRSEAAETAASKHLAKNAQQMETLKKRSFTTEDQVDSFARRAGRRLRTTLHPDKLGRNLTADEQTTLNAITLASSVLSDTGARMRYVQASSHDEFVKAEHKRETEAEEQEEKDEAAGKHTEMRQSQSQQQEPQPVRTASSVTAPKLKRPKAKLPTFETVTSKQGVRTRVRVEEKVPTGLNEEQAALFRKGQQEQRLEQQQLLKQQQEEPQKKQLTWGTPGSCSIPRVVEEQARVLPAAGGAALQAKSKVKTMVTKLQVEWHLKTGTTAGESLVDRYELQVRRLRHRISSSDSGNGSGSGSSSSTSISGGSGKNCGSGDADADAEADAESEWAWRTLYCGSSMQSETEELPDGVYELRVRALNDSYGAGRWSEANTLLLDPNTQRSRREHERGRRQREEAKELRNRLKCLLLDAASLGVVRQATRREKLLADANHTLRAFERVIDAGALLAATADADDDLVQRTKGMIAEVSQCVRERLIEDRLRTVHSTTCHFVVCPNLVASCAGRQAQRKQPSAARASFERAYSRRWRTRTRAAARGRSSSGLTSKATGLVVRKATCCISSCGSKRRPPQGRARARSSGRAR
jgi:hypothetical protein